MKLRSLKCGICHHWHNRFHCPNCGAVKITVNGQTQYRDCLNGKELVRGLDNRRWPILQIAQILTDDMRDSRTN